MTKPADYVVDNDTGANVRSDLNDLFEAIRQNNGYGSEPTTKYNYMWYANTSSDRMAFYKANATDRVEFLSLTDGSFFGPNGSASNPSYTFTNSASTGFYRSASNQIGVSNNSVNTALFKTTGTEIKGKLEVAPASGDADFDIKTSGNSNDSAINLIADTTHTTGGLSIKRLQTANGNSEILHQGTGDFILHTDTEADIVFKTDSVNRYTIFGAGTQEGTMISHDNTRNVLTTAGVALTNTSNDNGAGFESVSIVKNGTGIGTCVFINRLAAAGLPDNGGTSGKLIEFEYASSNVGSISTNGSATAYNVSSDYRLKENVVDLTDGITRLKTLKTYRFNYKNNSELTVDGFLAHEVKTAVPEAVTGLKDEVDSNGKAIYQGMDQSKLVPLLTAALQEAVAKIEILETKVAALEAS